VTVAELAAKLETLRAEAERHSVQYRCCLDDAAKIEAQIKSLAEPDKLYQVSPTEVLSVRGAKIERYAVVPPGGDDAPT
jgi:hypothetical protein